MLLLIKMVMEYCQCTDDLPMLVTEVLGKLVDMMKVGGLCSNSKGSHSTNACPLLVFPVVVLQLSYVSTSAGSGGSGGSRA